MKSFSVTTQIACPPEAVWAVLVDTSSYPEWAAGTHQLVGHIEDGAVLQLFTVSKPERPMKLRVSNVISPQTYTVSGGLPLNMLRGDRTFTLTPQADGTTEFSMREVFSGWLEPLVGRMIPDLTESFEAYAAGLKRKCEG